MDNFPTPEELARYESTSSGLTKYFKETRSEIIKNQNELSSRELNNEKLKYILAFLSVFIIASLSGYAFYLDYPNQAASIACTVIVGLAGVFVTGRFVKK